MKLLFWIPALATLLSSSAQADTCPVLEGTFLCRAQPQFEISVQQFNDNGLSTYVLTDPKSQHRFMTDGQAREFDFESGKGQYRADCVANRLTIAFQDPQGHSFTDRYYIERAALVRIRIGGGRAVPLSCAPTRGTWRYYNH